MLRQAEDMMKGGKSQKDACKLLGISVMTFHRWRKLAASVDADQAPEQLTPDASLNGSGSSSQIEELKLENLRLRRIVSDLLLEKMKVQEALEKSKR